MTAGSHGNGAKPATAARIYDYMLGGTHNFPADRDAADAILRMFPSVRLATRVNRAFLRRTVRYLCEMGITQFLDIGSGIPTEGNVHEVAQEANPQARVVYVDIDPVAVSESQEMLQNNEFAAAIRGDARDPGGILDHPQVRKVLDFNQPVAVLLVALLHFVSDDEQARAMVRKLMAVAPAGSYLVVSHAVDETPQDFDGAEDLQKVLDIYKRQTSATVRLRNRDEIAGFFEGLKFVEPGLVWLVDWKPAPDDPTPAVDDLAYYVAAGGVAKLTTK